MRRLALVLLLLIFAADGADARKRGHHRSSPYSLVVPPDARGSFERDDLPSRVTRRSDRRSGQLIPPGWQLQPPDPNWHGKRFLSPDGAAWFAAYKSAAESGTVSDHMKSITFAEGETITYLRGGGGWVAVSGFKATNIFYRKAILGAITAAS
jgi:hypothetical protein